MLLLTHCSEQHKTSTKNEDRKRRKVAATWALISLFHEPNSLELISWGPSQIIHINANYKGVLWLCASCWFRMDLLRTNYFGHIVIMIGSNCQCVFLLNIDTVKQFGDSKQPWSISLLRTLVRTTSNFLKIFPWNIPASESNEAA